MSSSNRTSKDIDKDRQSLKADRQSHAVEKSSSPCRSRNSNALLSLYDVRFPANICEHQSPSFVRRPSPLPGRGGGAIVVPAEKPSPRVSPGTKTSSKAKAADRPVLGALDEEIVSDQQMQVPIQRQITHRERKMSNTEGGKREAKNR